MFKVGLRILFAVVVVGAVLGLAAFAYNAGVAQGLVQSGKIVLAPPEAGGQPYPGYGYGPFMHRPFGFGFGFLGCLAPLAFFFLLFGLLRFTFWRGPWGGGHGHGPWGHGDPREAMRERVHGHFDEWHRAAHGETPKPAEGEAKS